MSRYDNVFSHDQFERNAVDCLEESADIITIGQGADGLPGSSAYDIAVENGFLGTEAEWLSSLKGDNGDLSYYQEFSGATLVDIDHGMNKHPSVSIVDNQGCNIDGHVTYLSNNRLTVEFKPAVTGRIDLN